MVALDYFYCTPDKIADGHVLIDGEEYSHLVHVMRKKAGDEVRVVDGKGMAYDVVLGDIRKKEVRARILASHQNHNEPGVHVTLAVGILKNPSKFDFLVEKSTELGVREIIPLRTERTIPSHAKAERWQKLALAAMKQSCRSYLPQVRDLTGLVDLLAAGVQYDGKFIAHEKMEHRGDSARRGFAEGRSMIILVGPEGGFSDEEVKAAVNAGYAAVYLGERRLRTETAAVVLAAAACLGRALPV